MSIKVVCDGCGRGVEHSPVTLNGWFTVTQAVHFPVVGQEGDAVEGNFCLASCIVLYLQRKGLVPHEGELRA